MKIWYKYNNNVVFTFEKKKGFLNHDSFALYGLILMILTMTK